MASIVSLTNMGQQAPPIAFSLEAFLAAENASHGHVVDARQTDTKVWMDAFGELAHAHATGTRRDRNKLVMAERSLVSVVDDDQSVRESLPDLLRTFGFTANAFSSARDFLASDRLERTRCLILDIAMPDMSGPELQQELKRRGQRIPIIFITACGDATTRRHLLEEGAIECLSKPFSDATLLEAVSAALKIA